MAQVEVKGMGLDAQSPVFRAKGRRISGASGEEEGGFPDARTKREESPQVVHDGPTKAELHVGKRVSDFFKRSVGLKTTTDSYFFFRNEC